MNINVIDYRGDNTTVNSRGDTLFNYRTRYFLRQQEDFHRWKKAGHKFRCFTQHENRMTFIDDYSEYDDVVKIPRCNAAAARNYVLNYYSKNEWIGIWDNDVSLYWNKLNAEQFPEALNKVCEQADANNIISFVPFNPLVAPYSKKSYEPWTFSPQIVQNALIFCKVLDFRYDEQIETREDYEIACAMTLAGHKTARLENISLQSMVNGKSTIFKVNAYHKAYKKPGPNANPKGLLEWDAQLDRIDKYKIANQQIEEKYKMPIKDIEQLQKKLWNQTHREAQE